MAAIDYWSMKGLLLSQTAPSHPVVSPGSSSVEVVPSPCVAAGLRAEGCRPRQAARGVAVGPETPLGKDIVCSNPHHAGPVPYLRRGQRGAPQNCVCDRSAIASILTPAFVEPFAAVLSRSEWM